MWQAIQYVTSALGLVAFIAAVVAFTYASRLKARARLIQAAEPIERTNLVLAALEFFHIDASKLSRERQFDIAMEQIRARMRRFEIAAFVVCLLGLAFLGLAAYAIQQAGGRTPGMSFESRRNHAFLAGYDAAFALAAAKTGKNDDQQVATINERLRELGLDRLMFPSDPMGPLSDAAPASKFAREVSGALEAQDVRLERAFQLGWLGVITTNTRSLTPKGFTVSGFAKEAGFTVTATSDSELLESLADLARSAK